MAASTPAWPAFFEALAQQPGPFQQIWEGAISALNDVSASYVGHPNRLLAVVGAASGTTFMLINTGKGQCRIMHSLSVLFSPSSARETLLLGMQGPCKSSPFKVLQSRELSAAMRVPPAARNQPESRLPSLEQHLTARSEATFDALVGTEGMNFQRDNRAGRRVGPYFQSFLAGLLLHPSIYVNLAPYQAFSAWELAESIVEEICETAGEPLTEALDCDSMPEEAFHFRALLDYLWASRRGCVPISHLAEPPDSEEMDSFPSALVARLETPGAGAPPPGGRSDRRRSDRSRSSTPGRNPAIKDEMLAAITGNVTALSENLTADRARKGEKNSMTADFTEEAEALFTLLSAKNWRDYDPKLGSFTKRILADKNTSKALQLMEHETHDWKVRVSDKAFVKFLATGCQATDVNFQPGGFTVFVFRPGMRPHSSKEIQFRIESMFGDDKISDDSIKHFSGNDFFLPQRVDEFESQLKGCMKLLDRLTTTGGIASEGCDRGLELLEDNWRNIQTILAQDPLFLVKFACTLDRAFQNFVNELAHCHGHQRPIRKARDKRLGYFLRDEVRSAFAGMPNGATPTLVLPAALTDPTSTGDSSSHHDKPKDKDEQPPEKFPLWFSKNPNPSSVWSLPRGKSHGDFFNPRTGADNLRGFPMIKHHKHGGKRNVCTRCQSTGKCKAVCTLLHVDPSRLEKEDKDAHDKITTRFAEICASA